MKHELILLNCSGAFRNTLFTDIFAWQIDFLTDTKQGDIFKLMYEVEYIAKKNKKLTSRIIVAQYQTPSRTYNAFYFKTKEGEDGYFDENGKSVKSTFLKAPLQFRRISSIFTTSRVHPILKYARPHLGIDYAAPKGTPVSSVGNGTIAKAQCSGGFGKIRWGTLGKMKDYFMCLVHFITYCTCVVHYVYI